MTSPAPSPAAKPKPRQDRMIQERSREVYARSLLRDKEDLVMVASIHPGIYWKGAVLFLFSLFLLFTPAFNLGVFLMFVSLLLLCVNYMTRYYLLLAVTNQRVMIRHGIVNLDMIELQISRIESVELARTIIGRILGYAAVRITGTGSRSTTIPFVGEAEIFRATLDRMIMEREEARERR